jgi:3-hydroxyacyl-[acyl-carrier-protein] dehydratase
MESQVSFSVSGDHASLAGHFPGRPVVPGVVLLAETLSAIAKQIQTPLCVSKIETIKFQKPLLPEQLAQVVYKLNNDVLQFSVAHAATTLTQGRLRIKISAAV